MFHPTSLLFQLFIAIMAMIRAIKIDHGTNSECSLFGIHIVLYLDRHLVGIDQGDPIGADFSCLIACFFSLIFGQFFAFL